MYKLVFILCLLCSVAYARDEIVKFDDYGLYVLNDNLRKIKQELDMPLEDDIIIQSVTDSNILILNDQLRQIRNKAGVSGGFVPDFKESSVPILNEELRRIWFKIDNP